MYKLHVVNKHLEFEKDYEFDSYKRLFDKIHGIDLKYKAIDYGFETKLAIRDGIYWLYVTRRN